MARQTKCNQQILVNSLQDANNVAYIAHLDTNKWLLEFVNGELKKDEAWFLKNQDGEEFIVLPQQSLRVILENLQRSHEEKLHILLRYEIRDLMPHDLEDTMAVAIYELEKYRRDDGNLPMINVKEFAQKIRLNHPNLFR